MKELIKITNAEGREINVIDSREVAEMLGKEHREILNYLEGRYDKNGKEKVTSIIKVLLKEHLPLANYFIESSYKDGSGKSNKCYLVTKMGCELLAHKMKGEKGILFSAKYVERFNQMERILKEQSMDSYMIEDPYSRALRWAEEYKEKVLLQKEIEVAKPKVAYYDNVLNTKGSMTTTQVAKGFGMTSHKLNTYLNDKGIQFKMSGMWMLYKEYDGKGYAEIRTYVNKKKETTCHYLVWTEKGKEFIYNLLLEDKMIK